MKKRKKGFTLIELLAVIVILAVVALIATPQVLKIITNARKEAFRQSAANIVNAGIRGCEASDLTNKRKEVFVEFQDGQEITTENTIGTLKNEFKGKIPDSGQVSIQSDCKGSIAVYNDSLKMCAFKYYDDEKVSVVNLKNKSKCIIGEEIKADGTPIFTGYACNDPKGTVATAENYFTFDQATGTITGYSSEGPKDVVIPCKIGGADVKVIGTSAFKEMGLTSVIMPDTVLTIQANAFQSNQITTLELGNNVETIGVSAFQGNSLTELVLPNSLKVIESGAYYPGLVDYWTGAFYQNPLEKVIFGSGIETIGAYAFYNIGTLTEVDFSRSENLKTIGGSAFKYTSLIELDLENSKMLNNIAGNAFINTDLTYVNLYGDDLTIQSGAFQNNLIEEIVLGGTITNIVTDAFKNNQVSGKYAFITNSYKNGESTSDVLTSYAGANRSNIVLPNEVVSVTATFSSLGITGHFDTGDGLINVSSSMFTSNSLTSVRIGNSVTEIGNFAFQNNKITSLSLGNNLVTIGGGSFQNNQLTELILPDSVKTLKLASSCHNCAVGTQYHGAFQGNKLESIIFGSGLETIENYAFKENSSLVSVDFSKSENLISIGNGAFTDASITELDLSNSKKLNTIGSSAFYSNKLISVKLYGDNLTINGSAFKDNLLNFIELKGIVKTMGIDAFKNNQMENDYAFIMASYENGEATSDVLTSYAGANRSNIVLPNAATSVTATFSSLGITGHFDTGDGLTAVGGGMFASNSLTSVRIGNNVKTIGSKAFNSNKINTLSLGNNIETISAAAFANNQLTELILPDSVKLIDGLKTSYSGSDTPAAFQNNPIQRVVFGSGIETIGKYQFNNNTSLVEADFSRAENLKTIESRAFYNTRLTELDLSNSKLLTSIDGFSKNQLTSVKLNSTSGLTISSSAFSDNLINELELNGIIKTVGTNAFKNNQMEGELAFIMGSYSNGVSTSNVLTSYAGANRSNIVLPDEVTSVTASFSSLGITGHFDTGDGLTTISSSMFKSNSLTSVRIGNSVTKIGANSFQSNKIANLELGKSVQTIESAAFNTNQITELVLPDSLITISNGSNNSSGAFAGNPIQMVVFGSGIETIGNYAFRNDTSLTNVDLIAAENLKTIGSDAFRGANITSIDLSKCKNLITIDVRAFYETKLTRIEIPANVTKIGGNALASNSSLTEIFVRGKKDASGFTSLGSSWNGTCTNIIYEFDSCYTYSGNTITDYLASCSTDVEIPSELDGVTITTLADNAFKDKGITRVVIPSTITTIGNNVFSGNTIDPIVVIGKGSESEFGSVGTNWTGSNHVIYENNQDTCFKISDTTVNGYYSNESVCPKVVTVPTGITAIADKALANTKITSLTIPNTVTTLGSNLLTNNVMDNITVLDGTRLTSVGTNWNGTAHKVNFLGDSYEYNCFKVSDGVITKYPSYCSATVDLSSGVVQGQTITSIGDSAFKGSGVSYVTLGNTITSVGNSAFENNDIISLNLGEGVTTLGNKAFYNTGLIDVILPRSLMTIGDNAFASNDKLQLITVNGKTDVNGFTSVGTNWYGTCPVVKYTG